jgi:hypothetical protein
VFSKLASCNTETEAETGLYGTMTRLAIFVLLLVVEGSATGRITVRNKLTKKVAFEVEEHDFFHFDVPPGSMSKVRIYSQYY